MKKIHINENQESFVNESAKIVSLYDTDLGKYSDEEEEKYVTGVEERFDELIRGLFELRDYINNTEDIVESERGERELDVIKSSLDTLLNG